MLDQTNFRSAPRTPGAACPGPDAGPCATCGARALSVCAKASDEAIARLNEITEVTRFSTGEVLAREGDPATQVFNITSGSVRVYKLMADGRRQIIGFLFAGDFLGLATGQDYAFSAEALEPSSACRFSRRAYQGLTAEFPELESALLERFTSDLAAAHDHMLLLGRKSAMERVASFLANLSSRAARRGESAEVIRLTMTRGEVADYLGLTLETVSRTLSALKTRRVLRQTAGDAYAVLDRAALETLAGE